MGVAFLFGGGAMHKNKFIIFISLLFLGGCAGVPIRTHQQFNAYFKEANVERTITVMPIDIKFYKLTAGGVPEQMDEWDIQSDSLFKKAVIEKLDSSSKIKIKILEENKLASNLKNFLDEENGLYRAIAQSIFLHTYIPGNIFPNKINHFDYTLGPKLSYINEFLPTDALLFISGSRAFWTGGRILLATWGFLLGAATGVYSVPGSVPDWIAVALVDAKSGDILWFRYMGTQNTTVGDLREEKVVSDTVEYLFKDFDK